MNKPKDILIILRNIRNQYKCCCDSCKTRYKALDYAIKIIKKCD